MTLLRLNSGYLALSLVAAVLAVAAGGACAQTTSTGSGQAYPSKPIRLISPYPPGGGTDASARIVAQALSDQMGQQVIVDSRGGASGRIGTELAAKAPPDGYTLVLGNVAPMAILPGAGAKLAYNVARDFQPLSLVATSDYVLTVHPSLPAKSAKDLLALAKAKPGELTYASSGLLGGPHLGGELINLLAKVNIVHIPYKGNGPAAIAIMTGESTMMFGSGPSVVPHVQSGKLRVLATTGPSRSRFLPDAPNMAESGYKDIVVEAWLGFFAPAKTPPATVARLSAAVGEAIKAEEVVQSFLKFGNEVAYIAPTAFAKMLREETERWGPIVKASGFTAED